LKKGEGRKEKRWKKTSGNTGERSFGGAEASKAAVRGQQAGGKVDIRKMGEYTTRAEW